MGEAVTCPSCKRVYAWKPELAGKSAKCKCGGRIKFPTDAARPGVEKCPNCEAPLSAQAVLCVKCGFNRRTGAIISGTPEGTAPVGQSRKAGAGMIGAAAAVILVSAGAAGYFLFRPSQPQGAPPGRGGPTNAAQPPAMPSAPTAAAANSAQVPAALSQNDATATPSSRGPSQPPALRAQDLLAQFPAKVSALAPKGSRVTIEGFVHGAGQVNPDGSSQVALIAPYQMEDDNAHVTCAFDAGAHASAKGLLPGNFVDITGTVGDLDEATRRLTLEHCTSTSSAAPPPPGIDDFRGHWRGLLQGCPTSVMDILFTDDHKVVAYANAEEGGEGITGTWSAAPAGGGHKVSSTVTFSGAANPVVMNTYRAGVESRVPGMPDPKESLDVPPIPPLFSMGNRNLTTFYREAGRFTPLDPDAPRLAAVKWMQTNIDFPNSKRVIDDMTKAMEKADGAGNQFSLILGSPLLRSHRATRLESMHGQFFAFEYTEDQTTRSGMNAAGAQAIEIPIIASPMAGCIGSQHMAPEVVIKSVDFDTKGTVTAGKPTKVKLTVRAIHLATSDRYAIAINCAGGAVTSLGTDRPDLDAATWEVTMPAEMSRGASPANPLSVYFTIMRQEPNFGLCCISDTVGVLADVRAQ